MLWKKTTEWCVPWLGRCFGDGGWVWDGSSVCILGRCLVSICHWGRSEAQASLKRYLALEWQISLFLADPVGLAIGPVSLRSSVRAAPAEAPPQDTAGAR